jgi:hypothetical protein
MAAPGPGAGQRADGRPGEAGGPPGYEAGGPRHHFGPPQEAFEACKDKKEKDTCKVERDGWVMNGSCLSPKDMVEPRQGEASRPDGDKAERLVCAPPRSSAPPGAEGPKTNPSEKPKK